MKAVPEYVELTCKTNYSFLRGASHPESFVLRAAALGMSALAVNDFNGVYGLPRAFEAAREISGFNLISGVRLTFFDHPDLTVLAQTRRGYGLLCRLITRSHANKPKGEANLLWQEFLDLMSHPGSTEIILLPEDSPETRYEELVDLFEDRIYLPLYRHLNQKDSYRTQRVLGLERYFRTKIIAANDVHYHHSNRRMLQDALTCIREGIPIQEIGKRIFSNSERYLKSSLEMGELFSEIPRALRNTLEVSERCHFSLSELRYRYPSEWIPKGETAQSFLVKLVNEGLVWRYPEGAPESVQKQIEYELRLIDELDYPDYFLTIWDIVKWARDRKILCQGRGSAANSIVCYVLGITSIDPVRMKLLFERFISAERGEPPDIDVDFEHERREEVIQHIYEKYGRDRAAMVCNVVTYRSRSAIREISKALGQEIPENLETNWDLIRPFDGGGVRKDSTAKVDDKLALKLISEIKSFPRHLSIHSGGFILSADPIIETVPVEPARMEERTVVQWDKNDLDTLGLLKVDFLSLGMLTAVRKCVGLIDGLTYDSIPPENRKTYEMMHRADTVGVFQIESRAQMSMLGRLQPQNFYDLVIQIAIVRPGPIVGQMVHPYLKRRRGEEKVEYHHPKLIPILGRTLGVPIFQEQVMKMAIELAGFTPGEADRLRKAIGAWRSSGSIEKVGARLKSGLLKSGLPQSFVDRVFQQIKGFAEYGFPESHSASFALIAYSSAYLKCHYPAQFLCAMINSQPLGFYSNHTLVDDAKRHGVKVHAVHPNQSIWDCAMKGSEVQLGFRILKGASEEDVEKLAQERKRKPFESLSDFLDRTSFRKEVLYALAMGDSFRCFGYDQRHALWFILEYVFSSQPGKEGQLNLFSRIEAARLERKERVFKRLSVGEAINEDYRSFGVSVKGHPMQAIREGIPRLPQKTIGAIKASQPGRWVQAVGLIIVRQRPPTAKGTSFATLEDESGLLDLTLHPRIYEQYKDTFLTSPFLVASGVLQRDHHAISLLVKRLEPVNSSR